MHAVLIATLGCGSTNDSLVLLGPQACCVAEVNVTGAVDASSLGFGKAGCMAAFVGVWWHNRTPLHFKG